MHAILKYKHHCFNSQKVNPKNIQKRGLQVAVVMNQNKNKNK
jgi:hypothetical protein